MSKQVPDVQQPSPEGDEPREEEVQLRKGSKRVNFSGQRDLGMRLIMALSMSR